MFVLFMNLEKKILSFLNLTHVSGFSIPHRRFLSLHNQKYKLHPVVGTPANKVPNLERLLFPLRETKGFQKIFRVILQDKDELGR